MIATVFVLRDGYARSIAAAMTRMAATLVSFVFCLLSTWPSCLSAPGQLGMAAREQIQLTVVNRTVAISLAD